MRINDSTNQELSLYHDALDMVDADSTTWPITKFIRSANFALDAIVRKILTVNGRWQWADSNDTTLSTVTTALVSGQADYTLADSALIVRRVRVKDVNGTYRTLTPLDKRDLTDDVIDGSGAPTGYDKNGRSIILHPTPNYGATAGVEVTVQVGSNYFAVSDTTKEPGIDSIFQRYISLYPARDYAMKYAKDKVSIIDVDIQRLDAEVKEFYATRDQDEAPQMTVEKTSDIY